MRVTYATLLFILILVLCGCKRGDSFSRESLTDDLGRGVSVDLPAHRVVTLAPSLTEMVYAAGAAKKLVGVGIPDDYPPSIDTLPRYSTNPVDFEAIAALKPDLVLATDQINSRRDAATLEALGIPTYFLSFRSLEDVFVGLETVGTLLGTENAAVRAADSLRNEVGEVQDRVGIVEIPPDVLYLIGSETLFSFGEESYVHEMIEAAGGHSVTSELNTSAPVLSEEYVLRRAPEVIMGSWGDEFDTSMLLEHHPSWTVVPAIRNGRVYGIDGSLVGRPGPRLVTGIREMARKLHPEAFEEQPTLTPSP